LPKAPRHQPFWPLALRHQGGVGGEKMRPSGVPMRLFKQVEKPARCAAKTLLDTAAKSLRGVSLASISAAHGGRGAF